MVQEIASAINKALVHQQAQAIIRMTKTTRNGKGAITAITHQNATAEIALQNCDIMITAVRSAVKGVMDVEENAICERLKIHTVCHVQYMEKSSEGLQKMRKEFEVESKAIAIFTQV